MVSLADEARVGTLASEDAVVLDPHTAWRVPWELLMQGPFTSCVLDDGKTLRHVTAGALVRSAVTRCSGPQSELEPLDYSVLTQFYPDMLLLEAAGLVVSTGWEIAVVAHAEPKLITPRSVFRGLLNCELSNSAQLGIAATKVMRRDVDFGVVATGSQGVRL